VQSDESFRYETTVSLNGELTPWSDARCDVTRGRMVKVNSMSRILLAVALTLAVTACSQGGGNLSTSLNDDSGVSAAKVLEARRARQGALGGEPSIATGSRRRPVANESGQLASLDDKAPRGSFDKAPKGALADRQFGSTRLDAEVAKASINSYRKKNGLKPLQLNAALTAAAKAHSTDLAKWDRISHFGSDGSNPWDRVKRTGYNAKVAAENVGTGQASFEEVLKGWKDSAGHNKNLLLSDAEHMGIALVHEPKSEFKTFWTLVVGASL
jgi:uncharacterized protein YkwD